MSGEPTSHGPGERPGADEPEPPGAAEDRAEAERRRRRDRVFGAVLADTTSDERSPEDAPDRSDRAGREAWLRDNVPPHHG